MVIEDCFFGVHRQLRNQKAMPGRSVVLTHPVWNHMADGSTEIEVNTWDCSPRPSANETVPLCVTYSVSLPRYEWDH